MFLVEFLPERGEAVLLDPLHEFGGRGHQPGKADGAKAVLRDDLRGLGNFLDRHFAALEFLAQRRGRRIAGDDRADRKSNTSELQSLIRISYAVFCLKKKKNTTLQN